MLNNKITTFASEVPPELVCLATCGLKALAGPIIDCVRKSNSVDEFIDCMKKKGLSIVTDAASCALDCFS